MIVTSISRISSNFLDVAQLVHYQDEPNQVQLIALDSGEYRLDGYNLENGFFADLLTKIKSAL
ncbi:hypothetical protein ACSFB8_00780 [Enterococcus faecalis]